MHYYNNSIQSGWFVSGQFNMESKILHLEADFITNIFCLKFVRGIKDLEMSYKVQMATSQNFRNHKTFCW